MPSHSHLAQLQPKLQLTGCYSINNTRCLKISARLRWHEVCNKAIYCLIAIYRLMVIERSSLRNQRVEAANKLILILAKKGDDNDEH